MKKNFFKKSAKFRRAFRKELQIGITAAFAFLIALSWRDPIKKSVDILIIRLGLSDNALLFQYISAIIVTLVAVLILMVISKDTN